jgi:bifunctional ADP-heptose synthase (sugar kinase/adenylyltransferase)
MSDFAILDLARAGHAHPHTGRGRRDARSVLVRRCRTDFAGSAVPIVKIVKTDERPGGAANVAQCRRWRTNDVLSVTGADEAGATLEPTACRRPRGNFVSPRPSAAHDRQDARRRRPATIVAHRFRDAPSHEVLATKLADFDRLLASANLLILSDYGKGGLAHIATMIERARRR